MFSRAFSRSGFSRPGPQHFDALRELFAPRKPRHPLLRIALGVLGVGVLALLLVFGLFIGLAMLVGGRLARLLRLRGKPIARSSASNAPNARVIEGEYRVAAKSPLPTGR